MTNQTAEILHELKTGNPETRYKALGKIYDLPRAEQLECLDAVCHTLSDTEAWMEYTTDEWGGYVDNEYHPSELAAQLLQKIGDGRAYRPLLAALERSPEYWAGKALESLPEPDDIPDLTERLASIARVAETSHPVRSLLLNRVTRGLKWREVLALLDHENDTIKGIALSRLSEMKIKGDERALVAELRKHLKREKPWNPVGTFHVIYDFATRLEMAEALIDFMNRPEFFPEVPRERYGEIAYAFTILGYWMGNVQLAVPRMCEILRQVKGKLSDKEMENWYSCLVKAARKIPTDIVADMLDFYEKTDDWHKDQMLTSLQHIQDAPELMEPFLQKHLNDKTPALGNTTTIGERIREMLHYRKIWAEERLKKSP